jgi:hypothetical protein
MWLRLRQIALVANQLRPVLDDLEAVLGIEPCYVDPGVKAFGLENTLLPIGNELLEVVAPIRAGTAGGRHLERRGGDGGYMVITQCDDHEPRRRRVAELGIRKVLEFDVPGEFRDMQLHPKDTGGAFLEIDEQQGGRAHAPDGPWHPAGHDWQRARRTGRVRGIVAAEIQCDEPAKVAARWSEIVEIPVANDARGRASIALQNATLRFVPIEDGRGEGLGAIDLAAADRAAIVAAAKARRLKSDRDDQVVLGGLRMNLV